MRYLWCAVLACGSCLCISGLSSAQDSTNPQTNTGGSQTNTGSSQTNTGLAGKQYEVLVIRAGAAEQGTLSFSSSTGNQSGTGGTTTGGTNSNGTNSTGTNSSGTGTTTGSGTTSGSGANPVANGDFGTVGNPNGAPGNVTGNTSGSINTTNTTGTTTTGTNTTGTGTTTTGTTTTGTTSDPPSYWTRDRVNGRVATRTSNASSSDYWTTARTHGRAAPCDTSGNLSGGFGSGTGGSASAQFASSGEFNADLGDQLTTGTWYAINFGNFSLWFAAGQSTAGETTFAGYASGDMIAGRTSVGASGLLESFFTGSFFIGQATGDASQSSQSMSNGSTQN